MKSNDLLYPLKTKYINVIQKQNKIYAKNLSKLCLSKMKLSKKIPTYRIKTEIKKRNKINSKLNGFFVNVKVFTSKFIDQKNYFEGYMQKVSYFLHQYRKSTGSAIVIQP